MGTQALKDRVLLTPVLLAIPLSLMVTFYLQWTQGRLNNDAYIYFQAAQAFIASGMQGAMKIFTWPLYPILIGLMSKFSGLPLAQSASIVNALLQAVFTLGFVLLIRELGGNKKIQWFGLLVIFIHPLLTKLRVDIYRDYGFWAFMVTGLAGYLRHSKTQSWCSALMWSLCLGVAGLFRIEAWVLLALLPFYPLLKPLFHGVGVKSLPWKAFCKVQCIPVVLGVVVIITAFGLYLSGVDIPLGKITLMKKLLTEGFDFYHGGFSTKVEAIRKIISPHLSYRECISVLFFGLLLTHPLLFIKDFSILFIILVPLAFWHFRKVKPTEAVKIIIAAAVILYVITLFYYFRMFYLANRHTLTVQLFVLLMVPFYFRDFFTGKLQVKHVVILLAMTMVGAYNYLQIKVDPARPWVLHRVYQYQYKVDAANWLKQHITKDQTLYTNDVHMYLTVVGFRDPQRNRRGKFNLAQKSGRTYDFYAFAIKRKEWKKPTIHALTVQYGPPIKTFVGWKDDRVVIFHPKKS